MSRLDSILAQVGLSSLVSGVSTSTARELSEQIWSRNAVKLCI